MLRSLALLLLPFVAACTTISEGPAAFRSDRLSVEARGSGPDVVLIPGLSSHPNVWESTVAAVPGYRYHLVHVAGFAGKPPGSNSSGAVLLPVAEEIARYIEESALARPALVGHSMGGTWAMMVAARHPELTSRVMVVDVPPFMGVMLGAQTAEAARPAAEQYRQMFATQTGAAWRQTVEHAMAGQVRSDALRPRVIEQLLASDRAVSGQALYEGLTADLRPELSRIRVPLTVLFVDALKAPFTPEQTEQVHRLAYANAPQAVLRRIPDSYHFIMFDQPEAFQRELLSFLQAAGAVVAQPAAATPAAAAPTCGAEHRSFNYMIGEWRVVETASGRDFAQNRVEGIHGGCGVRENLRMRDGTLGTSTNFFNATEKLWHTFYHDSAGFYAHLTGITNAEGRQELSPMCACFRKRAESARRGRSRRRMRRGGRDRLAM